MVKSKFLKVLVAFLIALGIYGSVSPIQKSEAATTKAIVSTHYFKGIKNLKYPQVSGLKSKTAQNKINSVLLTAVKTSYNEYVQTMNQEKYDKKHGYCTGETCRYYWNSSYKVKYQSTGFISILYSDDTYAGGAHGATVLTAYNFSLTTGKQYKINDILKTSSNYTKVRNYSYNALKSNKFYHQFLLVSKNDNFVTKDTQFYFGSNGIYLQFQEYEVCAYAAGTPVVKIPYSVYK